MSRASPQSVSQTLTENKPDWGISLQQGKHQGLINFATFEKIQMRLKGKSYAAARPDLNEEFPLRGAVVHCAECGSAMTASFSTSKTGAKHAYLHVLQAKLWQLPQIHQTRKTGKPV